jgi:hypothetical protein
MLKFHMMLGLPNCGSDWLMEVICRCNPDLRYYREFFNPACNEPFEADLSDQFGCELVPTVTAIARPIPREAYADLFYRTWMTRPYNFTKENYSSFKVAEHRRYFNCFVLYRRLALCLPGSRRNEVKCWYVAMYQSLLDNFKTLGPLQPLVRHRQKLSSNKACVVAHTAYYAELLSAAKKYSLPVVHYDVLMDSDEAGIAEHVRHLPGVRAGEVARSIVETRRPRHSVVHELNCDEFIKETFRLVPENVREYFDG